MSVEFTNPAGAQYISFGSPAGVVGLTVKTVSFWIYPDDFGATYDAFIITDGTGTDTDEYFDIATQITSGKVGVVAHFSTTNGIWLTTSATLTAGAWNHVAVSYDGSSTGNNPVVYINGASKAVTRTSTPSGTYRTGTSTTLYASSPTAGVAVDGKMEDLRVYSSILSASQISALYSAGVFTPNFDSGIVFNAPLDNCTALSGSAFDGFILSSSQIFYDRIGCAQGTPNGSPVGSSSHP